MHSLAPTATAVALFAAAVAAQPVTPRLFTRADGPSIDTRPFSGAYRWQQVHDDMAGRPGTFSTLAFRLDDGSVIAGLPSTTLAVNVWLSTAASGSVGAGATFDANHGGDRQQVRASVNLVNFPAVSSVVPEPRPFEHGIPFNQPFVFAGAGGLCWDVQVLSVTTTRMKTYDYATSNASNPRPKLTKLGTGCRASGLTLPFELLLSASFDWTRGTGTLAHTGVLGPRTSFGGAILGGAFAPLPLPNTGNGSSGLCYLYQDIALVQPLSMPTGTASYTMPLTLHPALHGVTILHQLFGLDAAANALGLVTSNAYSVNFVAPVGTLPVARISSTSNAATTGLVLRGEGLVVQLR